MLLIALLNEGFGALRLTYLMSNVLALALRSPDQDLKESERLLFLRRGRRGEGVAVSGRTVARGVVAGTAARLQK